MIRNPLLITLLLYSAAIAYTQPTPSSKLDSLDAARIKYIGQFQALAVAEMYKSGIPASITLAQGILETSAGSSYLANNINNHFGLKCGTSWEGNSHFQYDDDHNEKGILIPSCFRAYATAEQGFADKSLFLSDPRKYNRYGQLFYLHPLDYIGWAQGLQAAGYSSNNRYANRLIDYIERYRLYELDQKAWQNRTNIPISKRTTLNNGTIMVLIMEGESIDDLAKKASLPTTQLIHFNDGYWKPDSRPPHGTRIYLEEKPTEWTRSEWPYFYADNSHPIFELAQLLGIKTSSLRSMNRIGTNQEPLFPAKIRIQGKNMAGESLPVSSKKIHPIPRATKNSRSPAPQPPMSLSNAQSLAQLLQTIGNKHSSLSLPNRIHQVEKGDTLQAISRKYGVAVQEIKRLNNLTEDNIQVGQQLRI